MTKLELDFDTKLSPDEVLKALTDFSDRRPEIWPVLSREFYEVYSVGETSADVREGQTKPMRVWAKEHYDWSTPGKVTSTVQEASFMKPGSSVAVTVQPGEGAGSRIHVTWERLPTNMKGRFVVLLMKLTGGKPMTSYWKKTLDGLAAAKGKA